MQIEETFKLTDVLKEERTHLYLIFIYAHTNIMYV